ncbi:MAG: dual specificity protein phosphatase family protein [Ruminococcaceae bacterium]|nr:dual specificity protein phosphatase family protein [Oscillospiraceae bacterium]
MKVTIYSRDDMEKLLLSGKIEKTAIISFHDPIGRGRRCVEDYTPPVFLDKCDRVMQIALHDLDLEALADFDLTEETYFPEADELAEFIYKAKEDGLDIICQCEYGQSRSAGCAAAILEYFEGRGIDVFTDYRYYPNQLIYHKVFEALKKRGNKNV